MKDHYTLYWGEGEEGVVDTKGTDRLLAPASYSPSLAQAVERKITGTGYLHETVKGPPGSIGPFLEKLGREWVPIAGRLGLKLVGAYRSILLNDEEAIVISAIPTWDDWARYEKALYSEAEAIAWRADAARDRHELGGQIAKSGGPAARCRPAENRVTDRTPFPG